MSLTNCPECGHTVSISASMCPNCGFNVKEYFSKQQEILQTENQKAKSDFSQNYDKLYKEIYNSIEVPREPQKDDFDNIKKLKNHIEIYHIIIALFVIGLNLTALVWSYLPCTVLMIIIDAICIGYMIHTKKVITDMAQDNYEIAMKKYNSIMKNLEEWKKTQVETILNDEKNSIYNMNCKPNIKPVSMNIPHCPTCGSTNIEKISVGKKMKGGFFFGIFSSDVRNQFKCKNCGYKW